MVRLGIAAIHVNRAYLRNSFSALQLGRPALLLLPQYSIALYLRVLHGYGITLLSLVGRTPPFHAVFT